MKRFRHTLLVFIILAFFALSAFAQDRLYVVQTLDESLAKINLATGQVNSHLLSLGTGCNDVIAANGRLYVTNSSLNTVQEIDLRTETTIRQLAATGGINPYSCALLNDDTLAVTCLVTNNVVLLRLSDGSAVGSFLVGNWPEGILVHGDSLFVCVTGYQSPGHFAPGCVKVYRRSSLEFLDSILVGTNPQSCAVDRAGRLHVICTGDYAAVPGEVDIVRLHDLRVDTVLHVGGTPASVSFAGDMAWVAAGGWGAEGYIYGYRLSTFSVLSNFSNPLIVGSGAYDVEGQPDGSFFISCFVADQVEHRSAQGELLNTYLTSDGPGQMIFIASQNSTHDREVVPARRAELLSAYPNPFNCTVRLRLSTTIVKSGYINIYNISGQIVSRLAVQAGQRDVNWEPDSEHSISLSSSIYYARWDSEYAEPVLKLVYIR